MAVGLKSELGIRIPQLPRAKYRTLTLVEGVNPCDAIAGHLQDVSKSHPGDDAFIASLSLEDLSQFVDTTHALEKVPGNVHIDGFSFEPGRGHTQPKFSLQGTAEIDFPGLSGGTISVFAEATNGKEDLFIAPPKINVPGIPKLVSRGLISAALKVASPCMDMDKPPSQSVSEKMGGKTFVKQILLTRDHDETVLFVLAKKPLTRRW